MNDRTLREGIDLGISAVERDTGLSKDTLRVWERRYGFPQPARDAFGERIYPIDQVDKLRVIRRLMDAGHRPGRIISLPIEQLHLLATEAVAPPRSAGEVLGREDELQRYLDLIKGHDAERLRQALSQALLRSGLERFVVELAAPLLRLVGEAWARGWFEVFEEHLCSESLQAVLRQGLSGTVADPGHPRVLLTTFPNEAHGLGLLMAEALLSLEGCRCVSLGTQTPIGDIVLAAVAQRVDVVALSFSSAMNPNVVLDGLVELRASLPRTVELWAGGNCAVLHRRPPAGVQVIAALDNIREAVDDWRRRARR